jgi:hypothetical protein
MAAVRIYPVPFRRLGEAEQYRKFDWVNCTLVKAAATAARKPATPRT